MGALAIQKRSLRGFSRCRTSIPVIFIGLAALRGRSPCGVLASKAAGPAKKAVEIAFRRDMELELRMILGWLTVIENNRGYPTPGGWRQRCVHIRAANGDSRNRMSSCFRGSGEHRSLNVRGSVAFTVTEPRRSRSGFQGLQP